MAAAGPWQEVPTRYVNGVAAGQWRYIHRRFTGAPAGPIFRDYMPTNPWVNPENIDVIEVSSGGELRQLAGRDIRDGYQANSDEVFIQELVVDVPYQASATSRPGWLPSAGQYPSGAVGIQYDTTWQGRPVIWLSADGYSDTAAGQDFSDWYSSQPGVLVTDTFDLGLVVTSATARQHENGVTTDLAGFTFGIYPTPALTFLGAQPSGARKHRGVTPEAGGGPVATFPVPMANTIVYVPVTAQHGDGIAAYQAAFTTKTDGQWFDLPMVDGPDELRWHWLSLSGGLFFRFRYTLPPFRWLYGDSILRQRQRDDLRQRQGQSRQRTIRQRGYY